MNENVPAWLPDDLKEALQHPTMDVPLVGKALFDAERGQSYALARRGVIPIVPGSRRMRVATIWVRRQLMLDAEPNGTSEEQPPRAPKAA